jgi:hypothetical protein
MVPVIGVLSFIGAIVFLILGIILKIKRNKAAKRRFQIAGVSFILMVVMLIIDPGSNEPKIPNNRPDQVVASTTSPAPEELANKVNEEAEVKPEPKATQTIASPSASVQDIAVASPEQTQTVHDEYDYSLEFPSNDYPETALHILGAIEQGYSDVCTIDRDGADQNRKESLAGIDTKDGYDRDEWPMAMCEEGGKGASVAYIDASDNRGAGSWVGHQLSAYEDGEKVLFIVEKPTNLFPNQPATPTSTPQPTTELKATPKPVEENVNYANCTAVREAGKDPIYRGDPGYSKKLDRDGDGVGCE